MDITVRLARADELDAVSELTAQAYLADGLVPPGSDYQENLRAARHRAEHTELLVATDGADSEVLGTVAFVRAGTAYAELAREGEAEFRMLAVAAQARGRGVGEALVLACLERARALGAERVVICSSEHMHAAHRLYERLDFVRSPDRDWCPLPGVNLMGYIHTLRSPRTGA
ncbi:GNAT family N-acetyltransferase [Wenjunlia tyrosinilytica]|uniref:N-acetyltransferase n=1 Tax=Wenjunlia tyrosinilytica TaxID=1544741 RepID=A0A917ZKW4_9ACTN|nr:GNAT family N-acetyltransferase [Wenjunlia tyrosinilytica]GGO85635.1 N-acetyltransferase [Wenjunlia tyrosinilytica]